MDASRQPKQRNELPPISSLGHRRASGFSLERPNFTLKILLVSVTLIALGVFDLASRGTFQSTFRSATEGDLPSLARLLTGEAFVIAGALSLVFPKELIFAIVCGGFVSTMILLMAFHDERAHDYEGLTLMFYSFVTIPIWVLAGGLALSGKFPAAICVGLIPFIVLWPALLVAFN
jgi:hypothetical protein